MDFLVAFGFFSDVNDGCLDVLKQNYPVINRFEKNSTRDANGEPGTKIFAYGRETTIAPFEQLRSENGFESASIIKDETSKVNDVEGPLFVSTTTLPSSQSDDIQEDITEVLRSRKPNFARRTPNTPVKSTTQRSVTQGEYEASRTKERNPVCCGFYSFLCLFVYLFVIFH